MSCPISWSIIIKRETTKARTIFCFSPSLLCKIAMRHVRSAVESGSVAYSNITAVSHEYFWPYGLGASLRRECLDFLIPINERHLKMTVTEWVIHYNRGRPHSSLGPGLP